VAVFHWCVPNFTWPDGVKIGANQYGKAEVRVVCITRDTAVHQIEDRNVSSQMERDAVR